VANHRLVALFIVAVILSAVATYTIITNVIMGPALNRAEEDASRLRAANYAIQNPKYVIGVIYPFTGRLSWWSAGASPILHAAERDLNYSLREMGSNATVRFIIEDSGSTEEGSREAAMKLIAGGAQIIVGAPTSMEVNAIMNVTREAGVPVISSSSTSSALSLPDNIFRLSTPENYRARVGAELGVKLGYTSVVTVYRDDDWGRSYSDEVKGVFETHGLVAYSVPFQLSHPGYMNYTDTVKELERHVSGNRTLIYLIAWENEDYSILNEARKSPALSAARWFTAAMYPSILDEELVDGRITGIRDYAIHVGLLAPEQRPVATDATVALLEEAKGELGEYPSYEHVYLYDAVMVAADALLMSGGGGDLTDAIPVVAGQYYGVTGWKHLDVNGDLASEDTAFIGVYQASGGYEIRYYAFYDGARSDFNMLSTPQPRTWFFSPEA
jgi:ABC-type branched-subunit amino acid transport system substrate-binding protein